MSCEQARSGMTMAEALLRPEALASLAADANAADASPQWPEESWQILRREGVLRWCIPAAYGGSGLEGAALLAGYDRLAGACLTTTFILSQRDAACRRLRDGANEALRRRFLPALSAGEIFSTVGLSQLTTSRQHVKPSFTGRSMAEGFLLNGTIPWVTGAGKASHVVTGAVLENGQQILAVLPTDLPGIRVGPCLDLMALEGSLTAEIECHEVLLRREWLLAGPVERVMAVGGKGGTGGLETSCLALGLAGSAIHYL